MYLRRRWSSTRLVAVGGLVAAGLAAGAGVASGTAAPEDRDARREIARASSDDVTQVVMVKAPEVEDRNEVIGLGLDVTEHATERGIEVVLHDEQDAALLEKAGFEWTVEVADLEALTQANRRKDEAYAARVERSALPSGRTSYRTYDDYLRDMSRLARLYPTLTKPLTLANPTVLGERSAASRSASMPPTCATASRSSCSWARTTHASGRAPSTRWSSPSTCCSPTTTVTATYATGRGACCRPRA